MGIESTDRQLEEVMSRLITAFAHDLRVPLRSIMMSAQRIQRRPEEFSPETKAKLEEIMAAARKQEELISSVVEFDHALQEGLASDSPMALKLAIQTACMKVEAYRQAVQGTVSFDANAAPRLSAPSGISRVVEKILQNGLKFQAPGNAPVLVVLAFEDPPGQVTIRVRDNGIGIERQYRGTVFEPFKRLHPASEYPGSGLGLAICQKSLASIGGTIGFEDDGLEGRGIATVVRFPKLQMAA
jgi:signal transduction histidine kinase